MKKIISAFIIVFMSVVITLPQKVQAADWGLGIYSFYAWWKPAFAKLYDEYEMDPSLYAGPMVSVTFFQDWTLGIGLYVPFISGDVKLKYKDMGEISAQEYTINIDSKSERLDIDSSLSYRINKFFKIFAGFKLAQFTDEETEDHYNIDKVTVSSPFTIPADTDIRSNKITGYGPALGVSFSLPVTERVSLSVGTSGLYMKTELSITGFNEESAFQIDGSTRYKYKYKAYGNNSTLGLSYLIEPVSTVISIGGRFQVLKYNPEGDAPDLDSDYFYGVTASAMYLF